VHEIDRCLQQRKAASLFAHVLPVDQNEEPSGKPLGIFVGKEIYYTGGCHTLIMLIFNSCDLL
jgi:hypothetical protein